MAGTSSSDSVKRKRSTNELPSIKIPATKRHKSSNGMSIKIKRKSGEGSGTTTTPAAVLSSATAAPSRVRELGTRMWTAVRAARSKEGLEVAHDFLKLPPKRQYPDYYVHIKHPICLDDIKGRLDSGVYTSLQAVKDDLDLCFNNATTYNMERSLIWESAKLMQRIANREFKSLSTQAHDTEEDVEVDDDEPVAGPSSHPAAEDDEGDGDGEDDEDDEDQDEEDEDEDDYDDKKKRSGGKKGPRTSIQGLLNTRLQRLMTKSPRDSDGNLLIEPFLVLPNRREWPQYYATIEKPIAFDIIQKKLKKKSYRLANDFGADVELLFDNALAFNEDRSPVWLAAQTLRPFFHKLMADLPAEHAYTRPPAAQPTPRPKIKIKVGGRGKPETKAVVPATPADSVSSPIQPAAAAPPPVTPAAKVRAPATMTAATTKVPPKTQPTAAVLATPAPAVRKPPPAPSYATPANRPGAVSSAGLPRPGVAPITPSTNTKPMYSQPPNYAQLRPPPITYQQPQSMVSLVTSGLATPPIAPRSPSPELAPSTTIRRVYLIASPSKRTIQLTGTPWGSDDLAPVRCFAIRLGRNETSAQLKIEAERPGQDEEEENAEVMDVDSKESNEHGVLVDGKKFPIDVKCNGTLLSPGVAKDAPTSSSTVNIVERKPSPDIDVDGDDEGEDGEDGSVKMNGHAGEEDEGSESEGDEHESPSKPAVRATRSGRVIGATKNGKLRRRRKSKKGGAPSTDRVLLSLGQWDVALNVGSNVIDIRAGGKDGESWRVFIDRVL